MATHPDPVRAQLLLPCPSGFRHPRTQALTFPSTFWLSSSAPCLACGGPPTLQNGFHNRAVSCSELHRGDQRAAQGVQAWGHQDHRRPHRLQEPRPVAAAGELFRWSLQVGLCFLALGAAGPSLPLHPQGPDAASW